MKGEKAFSDALILERKKVYRLFGANAKNAFISQMAMERKVFTFQNFILLGKSFAPSKIFKDQKSTVEEYCK